MNILDNVLIVLCILGAFVGGIRLAGYYHNRMDYEIKLALQKQFVRLQTGSDADDPCQPYVAAPPRKGFQLPKEFNDRLQTNGQATVMMGNSNNRQKQQR